MFYSGSRDCKGLAVRFDCYSGWLHPTGGGLCVVGCFEWAVMQEAKCCEKQYPDGSKYVGELLDGVRSGVGKLYYQVF